MPQRILVPFDLVDPTPVSPALAENLTTMEVVALGHYPVPEQASNESASEQFADEARRKLDLLARPFVREGGTVHPYVVFGKDQSEAVARVMEDEECIAKLEPAANATVDRILIPIPGVRTFSRLSEFVSLLAGDWPQELTLFHVVEDEESRHEGDRIVSETKTQLLDAGVSAERVHTRVTEGGSHDDELLRVAPEYDAVIMYEAQRRLGDPVFGTLSRRVRNKTGNPVIVVPRDY